MDREDLRDLRREAHLEAEVGDVPGHQLSSTGVGAGDRVDHCEPAGVGLEHHRRGRVAEQRVGHHLLEVGPGRRRAACAVRRRLDVQAGELQAEQDSRFAAGDDVVTDSAEARQRGVATHMADVEPLGVIPHAEVAGQQDVQARRGVAGAAHDREQPDVGRVEAGVGERLADRLAAERQRLGDEALHAGAGAPRRDILRARVDHAAPGLDAGGPPHLGRDARAGVVLVEEVVPQMLLAHRGRQGRAVPRHGRDPGHLASLRPEAWNSPAVDRVVRIRTVSLLPANHSR